MKLARDCVIGWLERLPQNTRSLVLTVCYGLAGGLIAVAFQDAINLIHAHTIAEMSHWSTGAFLAGTFLVITVCSITAGWLLTSYCPEAAGSGIPQVKLSFWKDFGVLPWRALWVKFVAGALSIGGGCSLGREGPTVHLAATLASNVSGALGVAKQNRRLPAAAGSAAGLAAAFNAPLASITFVLEEIIEDLNSRILGSVILAAVVGALVVYGLIGKYPAFSLTQLETVHWRAYALAPVVAGVAALAGIAFQRATLALRAKSKTLTAVPRWLQPTLGAWSTWGLGAAVFLGTGHLGVFGLGYTDLSAALAGQLPWKIAGVLLVAKLLATCFCYGWGGCGGIFAPTLFLGGTAGACLAGLLQLAVPLNCDDQVLLTVVGMSSCLGAVVRAPITSILIVFEMTHQFALVPALLLGCLVSQAVGRRLLRNNFYEAVLEQDGQRLRQIIPPRDLRSWETYPVSAIANFRPVVVRRLDATSLRQLLDQHPYQRFPVVINDRLAGVLNRKDAAAALAGAQMAPLHKATTCLRDRSIGEVQRLLIEAEDGLVIVVDHPGGDPIGLLTLHDLLRGQIALSKQIDQ